MSLLLRFLKLDLGFHNLNPQREAPQISLAGTVGRDPEKLLEGEQSRAVGKFGGDLRLGSSPGFPLSLRVRRWGTLFHQSRGLKKRLKRRKVCKKVFSWAEQRNPDVMKAECEEVWKGWAHRKEEKRNPTVECSWLSRWWPTKIQTCKAAVLFFTRSSYHLNNLDGSDQP